MCINNHRQLLIGLAHLRDDNQQRFTYAYVGAGLPQAPSAWVTGTCS